MAKQQADPDAQEKARVKNIMLKFTAMFRVGASATLINPVSSYTKDLTGYWKIPTLGELPDADECMEFVEDLNLRPQISSEKAAELNEASNVSKSRVVQVTRPRRSEGSSSCFSRLSTGSLVTML